MTGLIDRLIVRPSTADGQEPPARRWRRQCGPLSSRWPTTREHYATALRTGIDADLGFVELASAHDRRDYLPADTPPPQLLPIWARCRMLIRAPMEFSSITLSAAARTFASPSVAINSLRAEVIHGLRHAEPSAGLTRPHRGHIRELPSGSFQRIAHAAIDLRVRGGRCAGPYAARWEAKARPTDHLTLVRRPPGRVYITKAGSRARSGYCELDEHGRRRRAETDRVCLSPTCLRGRCRGAQSDSATAPAA